MLSTSHRDAREASTEAADESDCRFGSTTASPLVRRAIELAKVGDRSARYFLFVRYGDDVYERQRAILGDPALAAQVTSSLFASLGREALRQNTTDV